MKLPHDDRDKIIQITKTFLKQLYNQNGIDIAQTPKEEEMDKAIIKVLMTLENI